MQKIITILLSLSISLFAFTSIKELKFEGGISIYGKVGVVDLTLEENFDEQTYKIFAKASSTGIVKTLSGNRKDIFISEGTIKDNIYIPTKFTRKTFKNNYEKVTIYLFDYTNNTVLRERTITKNLIESSFDFIQMKYIETKKVVVQKSSENVKLYKNDFLSLYLNMQKGNLKKGQINYVDKKEKDTLFLVNNNHVKVQKNHGSDKYSLELYYDEKSLFFQKIVSVGIAFYGDAYIEKVSEKTTLTNL